MALDKLTIIDGGGLSTTSDYRVGIITATKFIGPIEGSITSTDANFTGTVTIGGTLTYEDVTNIDSVGLITARDGIFIPDNKKLELGNASGSPELEIYHDGNHSYIQETGTGNLFIDSSYLTLRNSAGNTTVATFSHGTGSAGGTQLYFGGSKKIITTNTGITVTGTAVADGADINGDIDVDGHTNLDNVSIVGVTTIQGTLLNITSGSASSPIIKLGTNVNTCEIEGRVSGGENHLVLSSNNSADHLKITGNAVQLPNDNQRLEIGANQELKIAQDGTHNITYMQNVGPLQLQTDDLRLYNFSTQDLYLRAQTNAGVSLYYDYSNHSTAKLSTTATGVTIDGTAVAGGLDISGDMDVDGHTNLDNVSIAGVTTGTTINATTFVGNLTGNADTATAATRVTVTDQSSDTTCNVLFTQAATGNLTPHSGTNLTFNSSSGALTAGSFVGDGSNLTGLVSVANQANNRLITATGTTDALNAETALTFYQTGNDSILTIEGTNSAGHAQLTLKTGGTTDHCSINFGDSADHDAGEIRYTNSNDSLNFDTAGTPRMIIDSSGRLGIQGAATRALLDVRASGGSNTMLTAVFGANEGQTGGSLSDNTDKGARVGLYHYDTDALPYALFTSGSSSNSNGINFGGGTSLMNAATRLGFYTAANTTTATGTRRILIDSSGRTSISKNGWTGNDMTFGLTVHTGSTSDSGNPVNDGIMIVSQNSNGNQNSTTGKLMFCGHGQTNGPFFYGDNEQAYGKKGLVFHTHSTANSYSTQLEETARFTHNGRFGLGTGTAVDSLMHIQGNSDSGDQACQLTIEDEDDTAGSKIPSIQFKGNGTNTCRIRGTDTNGITFSTWNGSSQIQRSIIGYMQEGGAFLLNRDDRGWATFRHSDHQGLRTHIRQHYAPGNAVATYTILRIRRHWWGWGTYKIRLKALYYYGSHETTYYVNGHGAGGDSYSIQKEQYNGNNMSNDYGAATVSKTSASSNSPGSASTYYVDIQVNVPNYMYLIVYIEAYSSGYSTDPNSLGADSYCLM